MESGETPQGAVAAGGSGFTDAQLAAIGGIIQELLEKALSKGQPLTGDGSGPSRVSSNGDCGKSLLREREETKRGNMGKNGDTIRSREEPVINCMYGAGKNEKGVAAGALVSVLPSPSSTQVDGQRELGRMQSVEAVWGWV